MKNVKKMIEQLTHVKVLTLADIAAYLDKHRDRVFDLDETSIAAECAQSLTGLTHYYKGHNRISTARNLYLDEEDPRGYTHVEDAYAVMLDYYWTLMHQSVLSGSYLADEFAQLAKLGSVKAKHYYATKAYEFANKLEEFHGIELGDHIPLDLN